MKKRNKLKRYRGRQLFLLIALLLLLTTVLGSTMAYVVTRTPSLINVFKPLFVTESELHIRKTVQHPFGPEYQIPENISFEFQISLGAEYAGKVVKTNQNDLTADADGVITTSLKPGSILKIYDLEPGAEVTVTEQQKQDDGFSVQNDAETVKVTLQDGINETEFVNIYTPANADASHLQVGGTKILKGRDWKEGDKFTFQLEYQTTENEQKVWKSLASADVAYKTIQQEEPENSGQMQTIPAPGFDRFDFSEALKNFAFDHVGVWSFKISETAGTVGGVTYDTGVRYFDVTVSDTDMDGKLEISDVRSAQSDVTVTQNAAGIYIVAASITNEYAPQGSCEAIIHIEKILEDHSGQNKAPEGFEFELYDENGKLAAVSQPTSAAGETAIKLVFGAEKAGKTYAYTLTEKNAGQTIDGITYDDSIHGFEISVIDNLDGTTSAVICKKESNVRIFSTRYEKLEKPGVSDNDLENSISDNDLKDTISGNEIDSETETEEETETEIEIETETETETETESESETETETGSEGENETETETETEAETEPETESETETETETETEAETETETESETETETGSEDETETEAETDRETESETHSTLAAINTFPKIFKVLASSLTEGLQEILIATIPAGVTNEYWVTFTNQYRVEKAEVTISGHKELTGRTIKEGEFTFQLYQTDAGFHVAEQDIPAATVTNDAAGDFSFKIEGIDSAQTRYYVVKEDDSAKLGGIMYDDARYHVTVNMTDDKGVLTATASITDETGATADIQFINQYQPKKATVTLTGKKVLYGKTLHADTFTFLLYPADSSYQINGAAIGRTVNNENGDFAFSAIDYSEKGNRYYVVTEDDSAAETGITYDPSVFGVMVDIQDDGNGQLTSQTTITKLGSGQTGQICFENRYTPPETQEPEEPETTPGGSESEESRPDTPGQSKPDAPGQQEQQPGKPEANTEDKPAESIDPETETEMRGDKEAHGTESEKPVSPATGDDSNIILYLVLAGISGLLIALLLVLNRKRR